MPGFILHAGATVTCVHGGQAQPTAIFPRVTVNGQPIVTLSAPHAVAGCPYVTGGAPTPCVLAQWTVGATRVLANGAPVLLQSSQATSVPNGTPVIVGAVQTRVSAI